tara:strand:+ start:473 stop:787 length:315 start_codon:yes stop_codon:yes gene_type:complete
VAESPSIESWLPSPEVDGDVAAPPTLHGERPGLGFGLDHGGDTPVDAIFCGYYVFSEQIFFSNPSEESRENLQPTHNPGRASERNSERAESSLLIVPKVAEVII